MMESGWRNDGTPFASFSLPIPGFQGERLCEVSLIIDKDDSLSDYLFDEETQELMPSGRTDDVETRKREFRNVFDVVAEIATLGSPGGSKEYLLSHLIKRIGLTDRWQPEFLQGCVRAYVEAYPELDRLLLDMLNEARSGPIDFRPVEDIPRGHLAQTSSTTQTPDEFAIVDAVEVYEFFGLGEKATLRKVAGVERLVAVITSPNQKLSILDLYRIGERRRSSASRGSTNGKIDLEAEGLSERQTVDSPDDDSRFDVDTTDAVWERVQGLIEERNLARKTGNEEEAQRITRILDALYLTEKKFVKNARDNVRNTINKAIGRINAEKCPNLRKHFEDRVDISKEKRDYIFKTEGLEKVWKIRER